MRNYCIASKKVIWQMVIPKICVSIVAKERCGNAMAPRVSIEALNFTVRRTVVLYGCQAIGQLYVSQALPLVIWCDHYSSIFSTNYNMVLLLPAILAAEYPPECFTTECTSASTNTIDGGEPSK